MQILQKTAAKVLGGQYDIEIIEKHHNQKIDAPSGTAIMLADAINEELDNKYHYVYDRHSVRAKRERPRSVCTLSVVALLLASMR